MRIFVEKTERAIRYQFADGSPDLSSYHSNCVRYVDYLLAEIESSESIMELVNLSEKIFSMVVLSERTLSPASRWDYRIEG